MDYENFQEVFMDILNDLAPQKEKLVRANSAMYMNKALNKAIMTRSRLKNKSNKNPNPNNEYNYKKQRNYCFNLMRREKKKYYSNLNIGKIADNKTFWKHMKPFFSDKGPSSKHITLIEGEDIVSDDLKIAEKMNDFFANTVSNLDIKGYEIPLCSDISTNEISLQYYLCIIPLI